MQHGWDVKFSLSTFWGISVLNFLKLVFLGDIAELQIFQNYCAESLQRWWERYLRCSKEEKKCRREWERHIKKDTNWKNFESYLGWIIFSISLLTWYILFLFEEEHCSFLPNVMHHFQNTSLVLLITSHQHQLMHMTKFLKSFNSILLCMLSVSVHFTNSSGTYFCALKNIFTKNAYFKTYFNNFSSGFADYCSD